jgi:MSHA type pilus biogenesis protein MshL
MNQKSCIIWSFLFFIMLAGCGAHQQLAGQKPQPALESEESKAPDQPVAEDEIAPGDSAAQEDGTGYIVRPVDIEMKQGRPYLPVGADFVTKEGKVSLGEVIKTLADHKGFSVSWADDVDQQKPVDCNINAADNFYDALDNILRQVDYFYEIEGNTIVIRYKETKKYHLAMPDFSEGLDTSLGGNMLPGGGSSGGSSGGTVSSGMKAEANLKINNKEFNFWNDLEKSLIGITKCDRCPPPIIDKTLGTITINASRSVHKAVEPYLETIKKEAYKQVIIEAKIIEVALSEAHAEGIDWENVFSGPELAGKTISGTAVLGEGGVLYDSNTGWQRFLNQLTINNVDWSVVVSAFEKFGDARIIANPKLHILNGHGAILSAGQVRNYLEGCDVTTATGGSETMKSEAQIASITEGLSIGIKANIMNDEEVVLYVFPAITRLIQMRDIGGRTDCGQIQAPEMAVRELATYAKVRNNEIFVIGGLIEKNNSTNTKQIPVLGNLPYLGKYLFRYETLDNKTTELVILLKPKILSGTQINRQ